MSFLDQTSVDDLLAQVQAQAAAIGGTPAEAVSAVTGEIPGDTEAPGQVPGDAALAGEFAPPPTAAKVAPHALNSEYRRLLAIEVPIIVQLGQRRMNVGEVMRLAVGAIIEFDKSADDELELLINNKSVGRGHAVKVGENFGIRLAAIGPIKETIRKLGGAD